MHSCCKVLTRQFVNRHPDQWPTELKKHSWLDRRHPENNYEIKRLERSSAITLHVLDPKHYVDFDSSEILSKYWPLSRDRIVAEPPANRLQPNRQNHSYSVGPNSSLIKIFILLIYVKLS